jgi:hypothetical protein
VPQNTLKIRHFYRHILNYILWQRQHQALAWNLSPFFAENGQKTEDPTPEDELAAPCSSENTLTFRHFV